MPRLDRCAGQEALAAKWGVALERAPADAIAELIENTDLGMHGMPAQPTPLQWAQAELGGLNDCAVTSDEGRAWIQTVARPFRERWYRPNDPRDAARVGVAYLREPFGGVPLLGWLILAGVLVWAFKGGG